MCINDTDFSIILCFSIMGAFTMDVIASSAFGLDIDSQKDPDNLFISYGKKLFAFQFTSPWFLIMSKLNHKLFF